MRAAVYARRSTDEHQAASLEVQVQEATRYIERKGWTLDPAHVFLEDGVSRAEFVKRPALAGLRQVAARGEIEAIVVRDESRLGGDMLRTTALVMELHEARVPIYCYDHDRQIRVDTAAEQIVVTIQNFAAQHEREKISERNYEHARFRAERGYVAGGRVYGYDNVRVDGYVEYRTNAQQADIIREIFSRYARGDGLRTIASDLNERGVPRASFGNRNPGDWSHITIRSMLLNERYRGVLTWNRAKKEYRGGTKVRSERDQSEWIRADAPHLRIVDDALWYAVQSRFEAQQRRTGRRGEAGPTAQYLLSGLARCGTCGGPIHVSNTKQGTEIIRVYTCSHRRSRGRTHCQNNVRRPVETIDAALLDWLESEVLTEERVRRVTDEALKILSSRAATAPQELPHLQDRERSLRSEIDNLVSALAAAGQRPEAVVAAIQQREYELKRIQARIASTQARTKAPDAARLHTAVEKRLKDLRGAFRSNVPEGRRVIETLFLEPIRFHPATEGKYRRFRVEGAVPLGTVFITESVPNEIRTRVTALKGPCPGPG